MIFYARKTLCCGGQLYNLPLLYFAILLNPVSLSSGTVIGFIWQRTRSN